MNGNRVGHHARRGGLSSHIERPALPLAANDQLTARIIRATALMPTAGLMPAIRLTDTAKGLSTLASVHDQAAYAQRRYDEERSNGNRNGYDSIHRPKRLDSLAGPVNPTGNDAVTTPFPARTRVYSHGP